MYDDLDIAKMKAQIELLTDENRKLREDVEALRQENETVKSELKAYTAKKKNAVEKGYKRTKGYFGRGFAKRYFHFCLLYEAKFFSVEQIMKGVKISRATYYRYKKYWEERNRMAIICLFSYLNDHPETVLRGLKDDSQGFVRVDKRDFSYSRKCNLHEEEPLEPYEVSIGNPYYREEYSIFADGWSTLSQ